MIRKLFALFFIVVAIAAVFKLVTFTSEDLSFSGPTMGTTYTVKFYTTETFQETTILKDNTDRILLHVNKLMSTYDPSSELSEFNKLSSGAEKNISEEFAYVIDKALLISSITGGEYDVTIGPLVNLWGFGPGKKKDVIPSDTEIIEAKNKVGYQHLVLEGTKLSKTNDVYVDLSSIAKGYGVDAVAAMLDRNDIQSYLVEIGGEIRSKGLKPNGDEWQVAIESPAGGHNVIQTIIGANNIAIATSGDYRNYFEKNGVRYSHTISPKTGRPIDHRLVSVTVIDQTTTMADGLATAITVLGPELGFEFAQEQGIAAYMMVKQDFGYEELVTSAFKPYLNKE